MICICLYNTLTHRYIYIYMSYYIILCYIILCYVMLYYIIILYIYISYLCTYTHTDTLMCTKKHIYIYTHVHSTIIDGRSATSRTPTPLRMPPWCWRPRCPCFSSQGKREAPFCSGARCFACRGFTGFMGFGMGEWWDTLWLWLTVRHGKIHPFYSYVNHLFLWAMASMAM